MSKQTDIFSMFDIRDDYAEKIKREAEEKAKRMEEAKKRAEELKKVSVSAISTSPKKKEVETFDVNVSTCIYHLGQEFPLANYFSLEEIENGIPSTQKKEEEISYKKITGEDIRKRLEKDFPDLLAAYTDMAYIKQKNMVIAVPKARKKGLISDISKEPSLSEGSFHKKTTLKIPFYILSDFITLSKQYSQSHGVELHADIYFDLDKNIFFMDIPQQIATAYTVERIQDVEITLLKLQDIRFVKIMEIHSHHLMEPTASSLDNANERQGGILYAIVGKVDKLLPDITVRRFDTSIQQHIFIDPNKIFETPFEELTVDYDTSWVEVK